MPKHERMVPKTHYLRQDQLDWLDKISEKGGNPSAHIREAIDKYRELLRVNPPSGKKTNV